MKIFPILLLSFFAVALSQLSDEEDIVELSGDDFGETLNEQKYSLVLFYTFDNLASSDLEKRFLEASQNILDDYPGVRLCKMNTADNQDLARTYGEEDELALKLFIRDTRDPITYPKENSQTIADWLAHEIDRSIPEVLSIEAAEDLIIGGDNVGIYIGSIFSENYMEFLGLVTMFDDVEFAKSESKELKEIYEALDDIFILTRDQGQETSVFREEFTQYKLERFVKTYRDPVVIPLDDATVNRINEGSMNVIFFVRSDYESSHQEQNDFHSVALKHRGNISFVEAVADDENGDKVLGLFDFKEKHLPAIAIYDADMDKKYKFNREITTRNVQIFLTNYFEDNLVAHVKSAKKAANRQYDGSVMVIVGSNYNEIVLDNSKDVLIEWYAPWCGHCQHFAPTYAALAERLKDVPDLIIAKIDGTENEVNGVNIWGYPTLKFYPRNKKNEPIDFGDNIERSEDNIIAFIKSQGTVEINV